MKRMFTRSLLALGLGLGATGTALAAIEVLASSSVSGDQARDSCMSREINFAQGITVPMRRGGKNTIRLQDAGISAKLTAATLNNCPGCTSEIRRSGDTARVDVTLPADIAVGSGPSISLRITGVKDSLIHLAVNPGYAVSTNLAPAIGTIRKGDTVTVNGRDLDAGNLKIEPACVALVSRSATSMQLKYTCDVDPSTQGAQTQVKYFHNVPAAQRCELEHSWRIANFDANAKPDLTAELDASAAKPFRPVTPGTNNVDRAFCGGLPPGGTECARVQTVDGTFQSTNNCQAVPATGFFPVPALMLRIKNVGGAPSTPTVTKVFDGAGRELLSSNTGAIANGASTLLRIREAKSVRAIATGPTGCQLDTVGLTTSPFDPDVFVVKVDTGNALSEGGAVRGNNELRF